MPLTFEEYKKQRLAGVPPEKIQRGFAGEILPIAGSIAGGVGGFALGGPPGAIAGSALGGAAGETLQQTIEKGAGAREEFNLGQIAATGITSGLIEGGGQGIRTGFKAVQKPLAQILSKASGFTSEIIEKALTRTPGTIQTIVGGEKALTEIVKRSATGISQFARDSLNTTRATIKNIATRESLGAPNQNASRNLILAETKDFIGIMSKKLNTAYNIGVRKTGELLFERPNKPSRIISGSDKATLTDAFRWLKSIRGNTSLLHIDSVFERLIALKTKTPTGTVTGPETKAIVGNMIDETMNFVKTVYPEYHKFLQENLPKRIMINEAKEFFGGTAKLSAQDTAKITKRLLQIYNTGMLPIRESLEIVGKKIGEDITGGAAGALIKAGEQYSIRASALTKRALLEKMIEYFPRAALKNFAATGRITSDLVNHPILMKISQITKVSAKALLQGTVNLLENKTRD